MEFQEFPKWVNGYIAKDKAEEEAIKAGTIVILETKSAQGSSYVIEKPVEKPKGKGK